ncbi:hypothetical protein [Carboxylicivirga marina]|uniref:Lipocalin-like domain-containing protein n=1 Tax=Carboxylicivirga marina TaxID=2800988 RepID=A0ABS1HPZ9_9BACT|nr:hypothetical protein [Carboxylicivirga marina]MBK3519758.1 hypothetical protein [Carboxylicivirga marina]
MRAILLVLVAVLCYACCDEKKDTTAFPQQYVGTWQLISSDYYGKDSVTSNMIEGQEMIKIITPTHFAFFLHDLKQGKDSTNVAYMSGGGTVAFKNGEYTENLDFCTAREWETHAFHFKLELKGDTLIQQGVEELEELGLGDENLLLIEKYIRLQE